MSEQITSAENILTPEGIEKTLAKAIDTFKECLRGKVTDLFEITVTPRGAELRISPKDTKDKDIVSREHMDLLADILKNVGLELGAILISGNTEIRQIYEIMNDGKLNWRRWMRFPQNISPEDQALLDELAGYPELVAKLDGSGDTYSKYFNFIGVAHDMGLIKEDEYRRLQEGAYTSDKWPGKVNNKE